MHAGMLLKFGFTEKESALYLSLLALGSATVRELAMHAQLNRTTVYTVLNPLLARGFVHVIERDSVMAYRASPPERLVAWLQEEAGQRAALAAEAEAFLPELRALNGVPRIRYYADGVLPDAFRHHSAHTPSPGITVHEHKAVLYSQTKQFAIVIEHQEIADTLRQLFPKKEN